MHTFVKGKKLKKFILVLIVIVLCNFSYPKNVNAWFEGEDIVAAPAKIFWVIEEGVLTFLNNIFTSDDNHVSTNTEIDENDYETVSLNVYLTPENIIKGKFLLFNANIFEKVQNDRGYYDYDAGSSVVQGRIVLRETIAGWYYALRNFAIVALLSVLVYVGIRMIMSSVAQDKAKYKTMFKDWLIALCLLVVMHYLMIGILNLTSLVTEAFGGGNNANMIGTLVKDITGILSDEGDRQNYIYTNPDTSIKMDLTDAYAKLLVLAGIIIYTFIFAVKYLKREFTVIFLILLGPVSCITYPIDKISDGKAQAFNKWFSEFLYQVIVQPFHLLLYIVLIGTATELANANVIYALVCFAVMIPAEKFIKEMFGFRDKLGSPLGAFAGGAMVGKALSSMMGKGGGSGSSKGEKGDNDSGSENDLPPKTIDEPELDGNAGAKSTGIGDVGSGTTETASTRSESSEITRTGSIGSADTEITGTRSTRTRNAEPINLDWGSTGTQTEIDKLKAIHAQRVAKKWGSTNRKQRWINRGKKIAGTAGKAVLRAGLVGAGALTLGTLGLMVGKGGAGLATGAALGSRASNRIIKGARGLVNTANIYGRAFRSDEENESRALKAFKADSKQVDKAIANFRKNHNGSEPTAEQLDREMNDRFALSRYGLSDDQINNSIDSYQDLRDSGISDEKALKRTVYASKLAGDYSGKDFRSKKTMDEAINAMKERFVQYGASEAVAEREAREYLRQAAKIKGVKEPGL